MCCLISNAYCTGGSGDSSESGNLAPIISNSSLPEPLRTDVYNFEDPNRTCTWNIYYTPVSYEKLAERTFDICDAMKKCVELGKTNAMVFIIIRAGVVPTHIGQFLSQVYQMRFLWKILTFRRCQVITLG